MPELKTAITCVGIIIAIVAGLLLGDYLGYRIGRWRLAVLGGIIVFAAIITFVVYAGIVLL